MQIGKYRKKPVVIEAVQLTDDNYEDVHAWIDREGGEMNGGGMDKRGQYLNIWTLEGNMRVDYGDWVIKGVKGEFYSCKPDIFEATYKEAA